MKKHEDICVFSKGVTNHAVLSNNRMNYFPLGVVKKATPRVNKNGIPTDTVMTDSPGRPDKYVQYFEGYPTSVIKVDSVLKTVHPTQKPVPLMEYLIKTYTNEGETVLDFVMGSGTTGVACVHTDRQFIGIELDDGYFNIAVERTKDAYDSHVTTQEFMRALTSDDPNPRKDQ